MMAKKKKDARQVDLGKQGHKAFRSRFKTDEEFRKYMSKIGKRGFSKHPERYSEARRAIAASRT